MDGDWRWYHVPLLVLAWLLLKIEQLWDWAGGLVDRLLPRTDALRWYHLPLLPFSLLAFGCKLLRQWVERKVKGRDRDA